MKAAATECRRASGRPALFLITLLAVERRVGGGDIALLVTGEGIRFLLVAVRPIEEPVAWYGLIVINMQPELRQAMRELPLGTIVR